MRSVFILCAGDGGRWKNHLGVPKQLISFCGETLLERVARLLAERKQKRVFCVTRDERISLPEHRSVMISHTDSLCETLLATRQYWSETNVFLLGDVFYSTRAISRLIESQHSLAFFGRPWPSTYVKCGHGEMFGLVFSIGAADLARDLLTRGLWLSEQGEEANLWNLYQLAGGLPIGSSQYIPGLLQPIDDYTNDIDEPIDYMRRRSLYEAISSTRFRQA